MDRPKSLRKSALSNVALSKEARSNDGHVTGMLGDHNKTLKNIWERKVFFPDSCLSIFFYWSFTALAHPWLNSRSETNDIGWNNFIWWQRTESTFKHRCFELKQILIEMKVKCNPSISVHRTEESGRGDSGKVKYMMNHNSLLTDLSANQWR